jgi:hypothetical protein
MGTSLATPYLVQGNLYTTIMSCRMRSNWKHTYLSWLRIAPWMRLCCFGYCNDEKNNNMSILYLQITPLSRGWTVVRFYKGCFWEQCRSRWNLMIKVIFHTEGRVIDLLKFWQPSLRSRMTAASRDMMKIFIPCLRSDVRFPERVFVFGQSYTSYMIISNFLEKIPW